MSLTVSLLSSCNHAPSYTGYRLIEKKFVKEVNADCYLFEHIKSGARVLKIAADDPNKTFGIAFKTIPESDAGTPHIMEHSVLCGSRNFPVKSPFDVLLKGSLNTFLNAMTSADFTIYPVASMNNQDYFNLMHVYLDAVFNPMIYDDPRIFMQEGWHYELTDKKSPLIYKGIVYNEMKGAFSNPERELWYRIQQNLFPENGYRFTAGGYPTAIPSLTYEDFINFHKRNYHPSNSYIYLYGDAELGEELAFINREYLSKYDKADAQADIPVNPPFSAIKEVTASYPVIEGTPTDHQTYLAMNWVIGSGSDQATVMALDVLADVLVNQESAPVRKALQEAGIGKDIYASSQNMLQNTFSIIVQNANPADKDTFRSVIMKTLEKVCSGKIDKETLEGSLNRMEFRLREGNDAQKGLTYIMRSITGWLFTNDPFPSLEYEKQLSTVKGSLTSNYLEDIIKKDMVNNPYGLVLVVEPKQGLEKEIADKTSKELSARKQNMTPAAIDTVLKSTKELIAYQQKEDSPEAIAAIPLLKLSDIKPEAAWYETVAQNLSGVQQLFHNEFTNKIVYMNLWFDMRVLPEDKIPYAALLAELLGKMDAGDYGYEQLDKALNINTGGYSNSLSAYLPDHNDNNLLPEFRVQMKTTTEKLDTSLNILSVIINSTKLDNKDRLYELLKRHQSQIESNVTQNGFNVASTRLESYYSRRGVFAEKTRGIDYYWFITDLTNNFNANPEKVITDLKQVYDLLFTKNNLLAGTTCSEPDFTLYTKSFEAFVTTLRDKPVIHNTWALTPAPKNEGILTASKVQYVLQGFDFRKLGLAWDGKWNVLEQILSTDWLQTQIRIIGGAYGGFSSIGKNGTVYLASYRDPNLGETLANYKATIDYLSKFSADSTAMTRYIIGTIANLDYPLTPSGKGDMAFRWYLEKTNLEEIQGDRDAVLATTAEDIRNMRDDITKVLDQNVFCVYGNSEKIKFNKALFKNLVVLQK
jgi:Zn-dependent M16 (insulinase) family peptidase